MKGNERLEKFLKLQNENIPFENISKEIGVSPITLRRFLNKMGYKSENGKYIFRSEIEKSKTVKTNKKDKKINITQEDLDKICEVYDWYLEVKDYKSMKPRKNYNKKDVIIEDKELKDLKGTSIKVDKNTWEEFERLCSNSEFSKQQILTQALKDFMKEYKHLL